MSRNFELLQHAQSLIQRTALVSGTAFDREPDSAAALDAEPGMEESVPSQECHRTTAKLPCAALQPSQRQELLKLITGVFRGADQAIRTIAIAPADEHGSSAWTAACSGELLAGRFPGKAVCVADADFKSGNLHRFFDLPCGLGFSDAMLTTNPIWTYCRRVSENLYILSGGSAPDAAGGVAHDSMFNRVEQLRREFAYCVVATPPIRSSAEALAIADMVDGVVLVVEAEATRRDTARAAKEMLTASKVPLLGAVLNNRKFHIPQWLYQRL